jgi:hypothetical protein
MPDIDCDGVPDALSNSGGGNGDELPPGNYVSED